MSSLEVLVAAVDKDAKTLASAMRIASPAIIVNQADCVKYEEFDQVKAYTLAERGVGLSRNTALMRASAALVLFSDEDIVLENGYEQAIIDEFTNHPKADIILFNVDVDPRRRTYHNAAFRRVRWHNYGRYPAYSIAARRDRLLRSRISFSLLFGGGAKYSNGEDSLFLRDCLKKGLRLYASPIKIGQETYRESTWFHGYTEKFFYDRGVLYHYLYGRLATLLAYRFLTKHQDEMCKEIDKKTAYRLMRKAITEERRRK